MNRQKGKESRAIAVNALAAALVCIGTMAIQIPIPLGYMHLGNACILLMAAMFGPVTGMLAGGIGSAMADLLTGYTQWVLPTLLIKCAMGFVLWRGKTGTACRWLLPGLFSPQFRERLLWCSVIRLPEQS